MIRSHRVLVYGGAGHTGRFVVDELLRRGITPVRAGRSADRLADVAPRHANLERRVVGVDDPDLLRSALAGVDAIVNCAGPFLDTALRLARAAVAAGAHYIDVTAEQPVVMDLYRDLHEPAREAGVTVVPAMAFYGGLADLLLTAALDGGTTAEKVEIAIGLNRWWPTDGTRATGARNTSTRNVISGGVLAPLTSPAPTGTWSFSDLLGDQPVVELPFSEVITIDRHLDVRELRSYLNDAPLDDLHDASTPPPTATDEDGRSDQLFVVDVVAHGPSGSRRISSVGRDIYAITAPIVVEGVVRLLDGRHRGPGALAPGQAFDAVELLAALEQHAEGFAVRWDWSAHGPAFSTGPASTRGSARAADRVGTPAGTQPRR